jgi:drug/metabolite transporter (DMT)-like permease
MRTGRTTPCPFFDDDMLRLLLALFTVTAVISQLVLRRALNELGGAATALSGLPRFIADAALSPWIYLSVALQILSYVMWMLIVSREKLGVATASVGAGFYILMALSAWLIYGETLSPLQWTGIVLVTLGVVCISLGGVTP